MKSILFCLILFVSFNFAQKQKTITIYPNQNYEAGTLYRFFFGDHWRDLWNTPVTVDILDVDNFAGGITPIRRGGGMQTKSLRFKDKQGNLWKFRSVDKDPSKLLPDEVKNSVVDKLLQDQISTANPFGAVVVSEYMNALGIYYADPKVCYLPDTDKLGEFRDEFGGTLGMIELHPDEDGSLSRTLFGNTDKIFGTIKLFKKMADKRSNKVDAPAVLTARLLDLFIGDWDRHVDQWRWARYKKGDIKYWRPVPRDRDQAFVKYDGILPGIAEELVPQLNHFSEEYNDIIKLSWNGRFVDRRLLVSLTKSEWDSVTAFVQTQLSDDVIMKGIKRLPPEHYEIAGKELFFKLKRRRNDLARISYQYYRLINRVADIYLSDHKDYCEVIRVDNKSTKVIVHKRKKDGSKDDELVFSKVFDNTITDELRIYLGEGDDFARITGEVDSSPLVRIIGGNGDDEIIDDSCVKGYLFSVTPIPVTRTRTRIYDSDKGTKLKYGAGANFDDTFVPIPDDEVKRYENEYPDRGHFTAWLPEVGINDDDGLIIGASYTLDQHNFRADPYEYRVTLFGKVATKPGSIHFGVHTKFYELIEGAEVTFKVERNELMFTHFYGYGNETEYIDFEDEALEEYYTVENELNYVQAGIGFNLLDNLKLNFDIIGEFYEVELNTTSLISNFRYGDFGTGYNSLMSLGTEICYDSRDNENFPQSGFYGITSFKAFPKVGFLPEPFYKAGFDIRGYIPLVYNNTSIALRVGGESLSGKYPFFKGAIIGSHRNIRGYNRERFTGDASLYFQSELRKFLKRVKFIIKADLGALLFAETGRVFTKHGTSKKWHQTFGGGAWLSFLNNAFVLRLTVGFSDEESIFEFNGGMAF